MNVFQIQKKEQARGEVKKVVSNDPLCETLISDYQRMQLEEEIELSDGASAEFDQELVKR